MTDRKYLIKTKCRTNEAGEIKSETWVTTSNLLELEGHNHYLVFYPTEGKDVGKKHYVPVSNIHVVKEI
ncbi:MAG: hypothetical protein ACT6FD_02595 [Methanosarcinaceae archaeon]